MKNVIYTGSNTETTINVGNIIPITTVIRRFNRKNATTKVDLVGNAISIENNGACAPRYNIIASVTFAGVAAGNGIIAIYQDGTAIPLANATSTITTAGTEYTTVTIPASIIAKNCGTTGITLVNTGAIAITVINANILVVED